MIANSSARRVLLASFLVLLGAIALSLAPGAAQADEAGYRKKWVQDPEAPGGQCWNTTCYGTEPCCIIVRS